VTGGTDQICMLASEGELGVALVIELSAFPGLFAVAGLAFLPVPTFVAVVVPVAAVTFLSRLALGQRVGVTSFAANVTVLAVQPECGVTIVIKFGLIPLLHIVAVLALGPVSAVVDVVQIVA